MKALPNSWYLHEAVAQNPLRMCENYFGIEKNYFGDHVDVNKCMKLIKLSISVHFRELYPKLPSNSLFYEIII